MTSMRAATLADYPAVASKLGLSPTALLREVGIHPTLLTTPEALVPGEAAVRLLELSAQRSGCPSFGLRLAEVRQVSSLGVAGLLLVHQPTLRDTIQVATQYLHLLNQSLAMHLEVGPQLATLHCEVLGKDTLTCVQTIELDIAAYLQVFRAVNGAHWRPQSVHFRHTAPANMDVHHRVLGSRCVFNAPFNGICFNLADLDIPNPASDPMMAEYGRRLVDMVPHVQGASTVDNVQRLVHVFLPMGRATIKQIASALGVSVRSLQRELDATGHSFSALVCASRRERVLQYLQSSRLDIGEIGHMLGFSRHGSFTRWFIAQYATTPKAWREKSI